MEKPNRQLVLEFLRDDSASDSQIIDMLLLLLDDWEVREAVMRSVRRRHIDPNADHTLTQTIRKANN